MILFKILQRFLIPSVFIFLLVLFGLILILNPVRKGGALDPIALSNGVKRKKLGKIFLIIGLALYYIFSITPTADLILKPLENKHQQIQENELGKGDKSSTTLSDKVVLDKIVLLLGEGETDVLRASEVFRLYNQLTINNQQLTIIISGASALNPEQNPAKIIKDYLVERGIPSENIILEDKSRNTFESAKNIKEIIGSEPFFLVTSGYHMTRSMESFQKIGLNSIPAPTDFKIKGQYNILDFFPDGKNLRNTNLAFHEYFGILFYRLWYY